MTGALYALAVVVTLLRLYLRTKIRIWWWDDSFAVFAAFSATLFVAGKVIPYSFGRVTVI